MPAGKTERSDAIRAAKLTPSTSTIRNAAGGTESATSMSATFPRSVLAEGNEIRLVFTFFGDVKEEKIPLTAEMIARLK